MSNVKEFPNTGLIKDEAAEWIVKIHSETYKTERSLSDEDGEALNAWMKQSSAHREIFLKMISTWDGMSVLEELSDILPLSEIQQGRERSGGYFMELFRPGSVRLGLISASIACFAIIVFSVVMLSVETIPTLSTGVGEQKTIELDDGSILTLNTDSLVHIHYGDDQRVVTLDRGEAEFDVAKDVNRPFVVYAGDGMVWAVGTAFNVSNKGDHVNVIVSEGVVKVFSGVTLRDEEPLLRIDDISVPPRIESFVDEAVAGEPYFREVILTAGETAQFSQSRILKDSLEEHEIAKELAWKDGVLVFQGETFAQALEEISRYTDRKLIIVDQSISGASVGGRFKTDDIDALAGALALGLNIRAEVAEDKSILFSAK